jgi:hypothetical protein
MALRQSGLWHTEFLGVDSLSLSLPRGVGALISPLLYPERVGLRLSGGLGCCLRRRVDKPIRQAGPDPHA